MYTRENLRSRDGQRAQESVILGIAERRGAWEPGSWGDCQVSRLPRDLASRKDEMGDFSSARRQAATRRL